MRDYTKVTAAEKCKPTRTSCVLHAQDFYSSFVNFVGLSMSLQCEKSEENKRTTMFAHWICTLCVPMPLFCICLERLLSLSLLHRPFSSLTKHERMLHCFGIRACPTMAFACTQTGACRLQTVEEVRRLTCCEIKLFHFLRQMTNSFSTLNSQPEPNAAYRLPSFPILGGGGIGANHRFIYFCLCKDNID